VTAKVAKEEDAQKFWYVVEVDAQQEAQEAVEYALMEAGALGTESRVQDDHLVRITAYFTNLPMREVIRAELGEALQIYGLRSSTVRDISFRELPNEDWLARWKENWQPVLVGSLVVAPSWYEVPEDPQRILIRIDPGMAFGTGTHETTRLSLAAIQKYFAGGSFLDIGTGTGILAIAAAKLFPEARVVACDTDAEAIRIARRNASLNGVSERISFREGTIDETTASADCVCANLTAEAISSLLPELLNVSCGHLILSGILDSQVTYLETQLQEKGVAGWSELTQDGEWVSIIL